MEGLVRKGLTRAIGVSNFSVRKLQAILAKATIKPAVNQVGAWGCHFRKHGLLDWCCRWAHNSHDIHPHTVWPAGGGAPLLPQ